MRACPYQCVYAYLRMYMCAYVQTVCVHTNMCMHIVPVCLVVVCVLCMESSVLDSLTVYFDTPSSQTLSRLKRQTSVPNFRHSSHHPHPMPAATTAGADKHSSHSLARTSSAVSVGGVESAQSGYLASDGSSLTLDGEQDFAPSQPTVESREWNGHVDSLVSPTSPLESEIFDSVFEQHIQQCQYSNTSSASSVNQSVYLHRAFSPPLHHCAFSPPLHHRAFSPPLHNRAFSPPLHHRAFSPPLHSRETEKHHLYSALPRQSTASSKKLLSSFEYQPRLSPATSNEGVDV